MKNKKVIKLIILILLEMLVLMISFTTQMSNLLQDIEKSVKSKEAQINQYIELCNGFIDLITLYGDDYLSRDNISDSELMSFLEYNPSLNSYNLNTIEGTKYQQTVGNITGIGAIPSSGVYKDELNLALQFSHVFSNVHKNLPKGAWLYYTSKNDFINMYPWISSKDFSYDKVLQTEEFYTSVTPENNPYREYIWTPVYSDDSVKGLVVTLSSPIYKKDTFLGAVSFDITNDILNEMIKSSYEIYIYDGFGSIIADSQNITSDKKVLKINELLKCSKEEIKEMELAGDFEKDSQTKFYTYSVAFVDADLKMLIRVPISTIIFKTQLYILPILIMCILLFIIYFEVEKRKKSEIQLKKSLVELTSYHTLLENAAKYDFLTSTVNRRGFMENFEKSIDSNCKMNIPVTLIMSDIDYFKKINDTYGHAAGDKVLIDIGTIMQNNMKENDVVSRWGGEEFLIMLMNRTYEESILVAENIRKEIEANIIIWEKLTEIRIAATFGVAEYNYEDSFDKNISKADSALYFGKKNGRNQVIDYRKCELV